MVSSDTTGVPDRPSRAGPALRSVPKLGRSDPTGGSHLACGWGKRRRAAGRGYAGRVKFPGLCGVARQSGVRSLCAAARAARTPAAS